MSLWSCAVCYAHREEPFQYRCLECLTEYSPRKVEQDDPSNQQEHERQTKRLKEKVEAIAKKYQDEEKFVDPTFVKDYPLNVRAWSRPKDLYINIDPFKVNPWPIVATHLDMMDIEQRYFDNCWLVAAISSLASKREFVEKLVVAGDQRAGVYGVRMFYNGNWHYVIIDDQLPCLNQQLIPTTIEVNGKQLWPYLAEKTLAKVFGAYAALEGGSFGMGLTHLTGCAASTIRRDDPVMWGRSLFNSLSKQLEEGFLTAIGFQPNEEQALNCLYGLHAYQLLGAKDCGNDCLLIKLRTAWGQQTWQGKWSEQDKLSWSSLSEELQKSIKRGPNHSGIFWMHISDLQKAKPSVEVGMIRNRWHSNACLGRIHDLTQQQIYAHKLTITQPMTVDLFLWENRMLDFWAKDTDTWFTFVVQKRVEDKTSLKFCTTLSRAFVVQSLSAHLEPGCYYVYVLTNKSQGYTEERFYTMWSISDKIVQLESTSEPAENLAELIIQLAIFQGKRFEEPGSDGDIYILSHINTSFDAIVAINNSRNKFLVVMTDAKYAEEDPYIPGRGKFVTQDFIPPLSMQVVNTIGTFSLTPYRPKISSQHHDLHFNAEDGEPPLTPESRIVHHLVDLKEFTAKQE